MVLREKYSATLFTFYVALVGDDRSLFYTMLSI